MLNKNKTVTVFLSYAIRLITIIIIYYIYTFRVWSFCHLLFTKSSVPLSCYPNFF